MRGGAHERVAGVTVYQSQTPGWALPKYVRIVFARNAQVPVSATDIRRRVRTGEAIRDLVDPLVARYIQHNRLYQEVQT